MDFPENLKYTKDHEWIRFEDGIALVGITQFAQSELGDLVFVDLPKVGKQVAQHGTLCVVESTKAASDVYSPLTGVVHEVNSALQDDPGAINRDPYGAGWIAKLSGVSESEIAGLMDASSYRSLVTYKLGMGRTDFPLDMKYVSRGPDGQGGLQETAREVKITHPQYTINYNYVVMVRDPQPIPDSSVEKLKFVTRQEWSDPSFRAMFCEYEQIFIDAVFSGWTGANVPQLEMSDE